MTSARPININTDLTGYVEITVGYDAILTINQDGQVRARSVRLSRYDLQDLSDKVSAEADRIGQIMGAQQAVNAITRRYGQNAVLSDQMMGTARVVKIRI